MGPWLVNQSRGTNLHGRRPAQRGSFTAESAAGVYFEERQAALKCLLRLLADVASSVMRQDGGGGRGTRYPYAAVFQEFVTGLLAERSGGGGRGGPQVLLTRIIELLKVRGCC